MRTRLSFMGSMCFVASLVAAWAVSAQAHSGADWYPAKWPSADRVVNWRFVEPFPSGGGWRERVRNGASEWNSVSGSTMSFKNDTPDYASFSGTTCSSTAQKNAMHWGTIDGAGGIAAAEIHCTFLDANGPPGSNTTIHDFQLKWDSAENYYTGTDSPGSNQLDVWSIAAHEFGHATGRGATFGGVLTNGGDGHGHFLNSNDTLCPSGSNRHTMCQSYILGSKMFRSLETHDKDAFQDAY